MINQIAEKPLPLKDDKSDVSDLSSVRPAPYERIRFILSPQLPILGYHRVGEARPDHVPTVSAEAFERQLATLERHRVRVLSLDEAVAALERGDPPPRRSAVVTFDDGYVETYTVAWPILRRFGFPAAVFVTPGEVGLPGFATWDQLVEMSRDAITIGSHTMHHSYLPLVSEDRLPEELIRSKAVIEEPLPPPPHPHPHPRAAGQPPNIAAT